MRKLIRSVFVAVLLAAVSTPAAAQDHSDGVGWGLGGIWFSELNSDATAGADLEIEDGWLANAQYEHWLGAGRIGLRLHGAYTQRSLQLGDGGELLDDLNTWLADATVLLRVLSPKAGRSFVPFISGGAGLVHYELGEGRPISLPVTGAVYRGDDETRFALVGGLGADILSPVRFGGELPVAFRIEVADHVALESPFDPIGGGDDFDAVHNVRFTLGLHTLIDW